MTYLSIIEKLKILCESLLDFKIVLAFTILLLIFTIIYIMKKLDSKKYIILVSIALILTFSISIINNYSILSNTFDNFTTIFFRNIYFPSIYVYISVLVASFVIFIMSILNGTMKKIYKIINISMFIAINVLFIIALNIIAKNKIDIFSVNSLYTNINLVAILEISMGICVIWILSLAVAYITNCICERISYKNINKDNTVTEKIKEKNNLVVDMDLASLENEYMNYTDSTNDDYARESDYLEVVENNIETTNEKENLSKDYTEKDKNVFSFNDILNNNIPFTYYDNGVEEASYNLVDPQKVYEDKYNKIDIHENNDENINNQMDFDNLSLNDLIDNKDDDMEANSNTDNYSADDYRKAIQMLNTLKTYAHKTNINIDDAVAISLISNYSIDDCLKLKNILENNLN